MNIQFKQRLVGAIVLVSLAVIIVPLLLPGEGRLQKAKSGSRFPPAPEYHFAPLKAPPPAPAPEPLAVPLEAPPAPADIPKDADASAPIRPDLPVATATPKTAPKADDADKPTGWVVQVASFSRRDNALALRDRLRKQGHPSFVEAVKDKNGGAVYRVRVGPVLRQEQAEQLQRSLAKEVKLEGLVLRYP